jgi:hypothetical protein
MRGSDCSVARPGEVQLPRRGRCEVQLRNEGKWIECANRMETLIPMDYLFTGPSAFQMKNSAYTWFCIALAMPVLSSCQVIPVARRVPFNESDFAAYGLPGSARVSGRLVVTDAQGDIHPGNQCIVALLPVTAYTKEAVQREVIGAEHMVSPDPRFAKYRRSAKCDEAGNFRFDGVPAGEYFLISLAEWNELFDNPNYQWACERIKVAKGHGYTITLSHNPLRKDQALMVVPADDL